VVSLLVVEGAVAGHGTHFIVEFGSVVRTGLIDLSHSRVMLPTKFQLTTRGRPA
jgi:hypothetical protein